MRHGRDVTPRGDASRGVQGFRDDRGELGLSVSLYSIFKTICCTTTLTRGRSTKTRYASHVASSHHFQSSPARSRTNAAVASISSASNARRTCTPLRRARLPVPGHFTPPELDYSGDIILRRQTVPFEVLREEQAGRGDSVTRRRDTRRTLERKTLPRRRHRTPRRVKR